MTLSQRVPAPLRVSGFALVLLIVLMAVNLILTPGRFAPYAWGTLLGLAAPLIGAALASTPAVLGGRGGIDVSVGPAMGFVNAMIVKVLILSFGVTSPFIIVPAAIIAGALIGAINGFLAVVIRIQPIVATLGTYLVLTGITLTILPAPVGPVPSWIKLLAGPLSFLPLATIFILWALIRRLPYYDYLMATGSDDRAAYASGVPVGRVRFISYVLTGIFSGLAGLMLTALIGSADPNVGPTYTLIAISAIALGGVSLGGGRGGLAGAAMGAASIFLLQNALIYFNVSTYVLQVSYGVILVAAVMLTAVQDRIMSQRGNHAA